MMEVESVLPEDDDEDWMRATPASQEVEEDEGAKKRQKKVLTLDDLLKAERKETVRQLKGKKSKKQLAKLNAKSHLYSSSDEESEKDARKKAMIMTLERQVPVAEEVEPEYGAPVFAARLEFPSLTRGGAPSLQRALQASKEAGRETTLEELARSGFLRAWAFGANRCDESTLRWAYHQMAYAIDDSLERSACKFLCDLVSRIDMDTRAPFQMDWLPTLVDVKQTLVVYGYKEGSKDGKILDFSSGNIERRPPKNLRSVLEFIATCFNTRDMQPYYSVVDVEALLVIMLHLTLERGLLEILDKVQDCILALIRYFSPEDWGEVCLHAAASISGLTKRPHNGIFILGVLSGLGNRSMDLQKRLALHELAKLVPQKKSISTAREVAASFEKINLKAKEIDFVKIYYQLVIADIFLWCNEGLSDEIARLKWLKFLGSCSRKISIGDDRAFATKLRNTACFFIVKYEHDGHDREDSPANFVEEDFE
ncbi:hypothetical protein M758_4G230500 [Ceratodon purpureus]|uniref:Coiled-coil SMC6 And NSE5 INteracting (CANIN) domain-containing protein n=1 Tax=Ceratodon purpureus TaxID=3225 RepID=A0A8T0IF43_CERPU|nr:hypothetical protein KC19_4G226900 [Ceratodon purpureus]KAG0620624.1 hypothetical protein M758_4G230500 [Ceratodon purpureus]